MVSRDGLTRGSWTIAQSILFFLTLHILGDAADIMQANSIIVQSNSNFWIRHSQFIGLVHAQLMKNQQIQ